jgi:hypothetical protein
MRNVDATSWPWPLSNLKLRRAFSYLFDIARCLTLSLLILTCLHIVHAQSTQHVPARYRVETRETATFYVGKKGKFNIVLLDQYGNRLDSPADLRTTITVTTLDTLDQAKEWLAARRTAQKASQQALVSRGRYIQFARGQQVSQVTIIHRRGEEDESIDLLSNQSGRLHIYVESQNIAIGEAVVIVLEPKPTKQRPGHGFSSALAAAIVPISWQNDQEDQLKLDIVPSKPIIQTSQGEQIGFFQVELQSARGNEPVSAPQDIVVILRVEDGYAYLVPMTLTIPKGDVITNKQTELRTRPGGLITISANTSRINNIRIIPVSRTYEFKPGIHSTSLSVQKQRESAYANGQDEVELRVEALQDARAITPEEEGMDERKISFRFIGDARGVRFENGKSELSIPKGQHTGTIKLFSRRSVSDLKVVAESWNGLRDRITSGDDGVPVSFSFPWFQLLCAMAGGVMFPLLRTRDRMKLAQGTVAGVVVFGLALFGAILSDPQKLGAISITLTKLPTENALASFILGFLGSVFLAVIFKGANSINLRGERTLPNR